MSDLDIHLIVIGSIFGYLFVVIAMRAVMLYDTWKLGWFRAWREHTSVDARDDAIWAATALGIVFPVAILAGALHCLGRIATAVGSGRAFQRKPKLPEARLVATEKKAK